MIQSNVLYSLYRQSDSLDSFKRKVLMNNFHRPANEPFSKGFPLFEIITMLVEDDVDDVDGKHVAIEFIVACFETGYDAVLEKRNMERRIHRLLEEYYAQYLYDECFEYQQAYQDDIEASYEEKIAA